nr:transglutaminase domain-containing protein [uncultured Caproiciproducens sp.]
MKKFLTAIMMLFLAGLVCILVYLALYHDSLGLQWNNPFTSLLQGTSAFSAPQESGGSTKQEVVSETEENGNNGASISKAVAPASKFYPLFHQTEGLDCLTDSASRTLYQGMLKTVYAIAPDADKDGYYPADTATVKKEKLSEKQIRAAVLAFRSDNPQLFWVVNRYSYTYDGKDTAVRLYGYLPPAQCNALIKKMNASVSSIVGGIPAGLSELDREINLFQAIAKMCTYDAAAVTDLKRWASHAANGALVDGTAVCEGYARAMQLLSAYCGLDCRTVNGEGNGAAHMWNVIRIDGLWYHLDPTWGDGEPLNYEYFNVTDSIIRTDHSISGNILLVKGEKIKDEDGVSADYNLPLLACNSMKANYFRVKGIPVSGFNSANNKKAADAIAAAAKSKSPAVEFYIDASLNYDETVAQMVGAPRYQLLTYIRAANKAAVAGHKINEDKIQYVLAKKSRGMTVILNYQ